MISSRNSFYLRARRALLCGAALLCASLATPQQSARAAEPTVQSALRVEGKNFVDQTGATVRLRGVNIGGWLVPEGWMNGQTDSADRWAIEQLEARFGTEKAEALMNAWFDNWFTIADLDVIKSWNFNLIRVPFGYRTLQNADGSWRRNSEGEIDFSRLDWVVNEAAKRGIYVVLDFHIWPGQKANYQKISRLEAGADEERAQVAAIWSEVAKHYQGNAAIAGFDLVNEPEGSPGDTLQRVMTDAIRAQDANRIVIGESQNYANFKEPYWNKAVYSAHYPGENDKGTPEEVVSIWEKSVQIPDNLDVAVPVFIGELKAPQDNAESAFAYANAMNKRDWSWAVWTYKTVDMGGWGAFNYYKEMRYDLSKDSYESLMEKWTSGLSQWQKPDQPKNFYWNDWWIEGFKKAANQ